MRTTKILEAECIGLEPTPSPECPFLLSHSTMAGWGKLAGGVWFGGNLLMRCVLEPAFGATGFQAGAFNLRVDQALLEAPHSRRPAVFFSPMSEACEVYDVKIQNIRYSSIDQSGSGLTIKSCQVIAYRV